MTTNIEISIWNQCLATAWSCELYMQSDDMATKVVSSISNQSLSPLKLWALFAIRAYGY